MLQKHGSPIESLGDDRERKGSRSQKSEGFKDSRIQGFKWFSWYLFFKTKRGKESEKTGFATHPHCQTSKLLQGKAFGREL